MKLLTLNTHSLAEPGYEEKKDIFLRAVLEERPDVMALQEVNQTAGGEDVSTVELLASGYMECPDTMPRVGRDNHAFRAAVWLAEKGFPCFWSWIPAKLGYDTYDEGTAVFSRRPILEVNQFYLTGTRDYGNWKTRKALAVKTETENGPGWFFSLHMGWWKDEEEPFLRQWRALSAVTDPLRREGDVWLMGDFNSPAGVREEGYDCIAADGWEDAYALAEEKGGEITVPGVIDGWRNSGEVSGMRMDFIWHGGPAQSSASGGWKVLRAGAIFDGKNRPAVSDHFGVTAEYERRD
ncbi:MAG TPA: endonuclease/exonuclease/phosphatase family protein [Candidatus Lachnoclostridium stercorigallinarum]|uniref:Endonuclease/exonuclease/phosphatase family protein n=1 Tax=Candidatus Lachnoclostridium stercorigallinarum TaxID=2838634 RepID=A0A9D2GIL5_9FIRM|nr:endonuclease/exonuclease/phosphatase family protein [Candidatus Lachnoclostridium stercorigallinarum]